MNEESPDFSRRSVNEQYLDRRRPAGIWQATFDRVAAIDLPLGIIRQAQADPAHIHGRALRDYLDDDWTLFSDTLPAGPYPVEQNLNEAYLIEPAHMPE
jgi:hypothetical protein